MKKIIILFLIISGILLALGTNRGTAQEKLTADQIMHRVDSRPIPKDLTAEMAMNLIDRKGQVRQRTVKTLRMGDDKQIMWFLLPADVKGSSFLRISYEDREDDMWLYLPAFGKVRRIASHTKKGNFMGTDFTFEDLGDRKLGDYAYRLVKEEKVGEKSCWVVESTPNKGVSTDYSRIVSWIWKDEYIPLREEFYDGSAALRKVMTMELTQLKKYWVPKRVLMEDLKAAHKTAMIFDKIDVDTGLSEKIFDTSSLTRIY